MPKLSSEALAVLSQGTITQSFTDSGWAVDWVAGTEAQLSGVSSTLLASTADEVFNWFKISWLVVLNGNNDTFGGYQWWLIRQKTTDSLPNFDSANFEYDRLIRDHAVIARGKKPVICGTNSATGGQASLHFELVEKYNVRLKKGEEMRLVVRPLEATTDARTIVLVEYRKAGRVAE